MGANSAIEWTDHTFNPWWGCTKVSPGCKNCYAETFSKRVGLKVWGDDAPRRFFGDKHWAEPLKWDREAKAAGVRKRVFCGSMCDILENSRDLDVARIRLGFLIQSTLHLDWLLLSKRPEMFTGLLPSFIASPNVWTLTTVESPAYLHRIQHIRNLPSVVRGLSMEPLLADIPDIGYHLDGIDWVIVGGESGPGARPMRPDWARRIRDACVDRGIAFFFKQWGGTQKAKAGSLLDGREWKEFPHA
jgi:protein gp37